MKLLIEVDLDVPEGWSEADANDIIGFHLGTNDLNMLDVDLSAATVRHHHLVSVKRGFAVSLHETWKKGERVEQSINKGSGSNPNRTYRPGTVVRIDDHYARHEQLLIAFDDGETRYINPDVMRHIR